MKRALINGAEVVQTEPIGSDFPVAAPMFWADCDDAVEAGFAYDDATGLFTDTRPAPAQIDAAKQLLAQQKVDDAIHRVVRDALWDIELRLRAAGQASAAPDIAAVADKNAYTAALVARVKAEL